VVGNVLRLAVFGWCFRVFSSFFGDLLVGPGFGVVEEGFEKSSESLSSAQTTSII